MGIADNLRALRDLIVKVHDDKLRAELQDFTLKAQSEALSLQEKYQGKLEETQQLKDMIKKLESLAEFDMVPTKQQVLLNRKDNQLYCPTCWGAEQLPIMISTRQNTGHGICNHCKGHFPSAFATKEPAE